MPECDCGGWVSKAYIRVLAPEDVDTDEELEACPSCAGRIGAWEAYQ